MKKRSGPSLTLWAESSANFADIRGWAGLGDWEDDAGGRGGKGGAFDLTTSPSRRRFPTARKCHSNFRITCLNHLIA